MHKAPKLVYLLRKSIQTETDAIPVLRHNDFPLRFFFKGQEVSITVTQKGNLEIAKRRLTGTNGE